MPQRPAGGERSKWVDASRAGGPGRWASHHVRRSPERRRRQRRGFQRRRGAGRERGRHPRRDLPAREGGGRGPHPREELAPADGTDPAAERYPPCRRGRPDDRPRTGPPPDRRDRRVLAAKESQGPRDRSRRVVLVRGHRLRHDGEHGPTPATPITPHDDAHRPGRAPRLQRAPLLPRAPAVSPHPEAAPHPSARRPTPGALPRPRLLHRGSPLQPGLDGPVAMEDSPLAPAPRIHVVPGHDGGGVSAPSPSPLLRQARPCAPLLGRALYRIEPDTRNTGSAMANERLSISQPDQPTRSTRYPG